MDEHMFFIKFELRLVKINVEWHHTLLSSLSLCFFFSSSHLRTLQICLHVLRFRQLPQLPQFSLRRQGGQVPHFFLFLFSRSTLTSAFPLGVARDRSPACWCSMSIDLRREDLLVKCCLCKKVSAFFTPVEKSLLLTGSELDLGLSLGMVVLVVLRLNISKNERDLKTWIKNCV